jgi:hypothetical protein
VPWSSRYLLATTIPRSVQSVLHGARIGITMRGCVTQRFSLPSDAVRFSLSCACCMRIRLLMEA